jgi:beta-phosphoglucomutase-like phosphatase (HAD superfamily)
LARGLWGIVSAKSRCPMESILKREGLLALFGAIVVGEEVLNHKPDPEGLRWAMEQLKRSSSDCVSQVLERVFGLVEWAGHRSSEAVRG